LTEIVNGAKEKFNAKQKAKEDKAKEKEDKEKKIKEEPTTK